MEPRAPTQSGVAYSLLIEQWCRIGARRQRLFHLRQPANTYLRALLRGSCWMQVSQEPFQQTHFSVRLKYFFPKVLLRDTSAIIIIFNMHMCQAIIEILAGVAKVYPNNRCRE